MKFETFIGIDVSKSTLDFSVRDNQKFLFHLQVSNCEKGIKEVLKRCRKEKIDFATTLFCMEHTGIYTNILLKFISSKNYSVWLEQGLQIKRSLGVQRGKNDKVDSERISEYAFRFQDKCKLWEPSRKVLQQLKKMVSLRRRLIKTKNILLKSLTESKAFEDKSILKEVTFLTSPILNKIDKQLLQVDTKIKEVIINDERLSELFEIITSVDGVGRVTAWELMITTNEFKNIQEGKKYACYSGVVPFEHVSGSSIRGKSRVNRMANKSVKQLLHMAALSSIVMKGELKEYYVRKVAEGKNKMSVINAIRNKLVLRIFACVRDGRKYEKTYTDSLV